MTDEPLTQPIIKTRWPWWRSSGVSLYTTLHHSISLVPVGDGWDRPEKDAVRSLLNHLLPEECKSPVDEWATSFRSPRNGCDLNTLLRMAVAGTPLMDVYNVGNYPVWGLLFESEFLRLVSIGQAEFDAETVIYALAREHRR